MTHSLVWINSMQGIMHIFNRSYSRSINQYCTKAKSYRPHATSDQRCPEGPSGRVRDYNEGTEEEAIY